MSGEMSSQIDSGNNANTLQSANDGQLSTSVTFMTQQEWLGIHQGDCLQLLARMPDGMADLIITSPPYADNRKKTYTGVPMANYVEWFCPIADQLYRVLKPTGSFVLNIKERAINGERQTYVLELIQAIVLDTDWIDQVMALIGVQDEQERVSEQRRKLEEKKRRLGKAFVEGMYSDSDYEREKHHIDMELETLVVPQADETVKAGELIDNLPELWEEANMEERRKLLLAMLDAVYFDTKESKSVVAIQPKAGFLTVFQVATTRNGHEVQLIKGPKDHGSEAEPCFWWRRGGVERYPKRRIGVMVVQRWGPSEMPVAV